MANCPKCGHKLKLTDLSQFCPACGVNMRFVGFEENFYREAKYAELSQANVKVKFNRFKAAFVGSKLTIVRLCFALLPVLVPLFVSAFRRADELATAMECRCYHGGEGRTRMKALQMQAADWLALLFWCLMVAGVFTLRRFGL